MPENAKPQLPWGPDAGRSTARMDTSLKSTVGVHYRYAPRGRIGACVKVIGVYGVDTTMVLETEG